ncbi:hypothetical protein BDN67DRAFT_984572 [Paxillus ammoniavirescens]|nr:hypothetical protein BDN67DRAFT_984572 [Paxillus ammoniavirescens]
MDKWGSQLRLTNVLGWTRMDPDGRRGLNLYMKAGSVANRAWRVGEMDHDMKGSVGNISSLQRTYEWRSEMGDWAEKAVEVYFNRYAEYSAHEAHETYVAWAVPEPEEVTDRKGQKVFVPPSIYPYMWWEVDESDPESPVPIGLFLHECILDTFPFYLETVHVVPAKIRH